jgi:alkylation response protein AidB-like acyl-CoA dehydrogenase
LNFELTEEQQAIVGMIRDVARSETAPTEAILAELGLLGMGASAELGGSELGLIELCLCLEELAKNHPSVARVLQVHNLLCVEPILRRGDPETQKRLVSVLTHRLGSFGRSSDGVRADNVVMGRDAAVVIVARGGVGEPAAWTAFEGPLDVLDEEPVLGFRGAQPVDVSLEGCSGQSLNVDGDDTEIFERARIGMAAIALGIAGGALAHGAGYASERQQFGRPISRFQAIKWKLADSATWLHAARMMTYRAAWNADNGKAVVPGGSMAWRLATDAARLCTDHAVQIYGGYGYTTEYPVEQLFRDARASALVDDHVDRAKTRIAHALVG